MPVLNFGALGNISVTLKPNPNNRKPTARNNAQGLVYQYPSLGNRGTQKTRNNSKMMLPMIKAHRPRFKVATFGMFLATIIPRAKAIKEVSMALVASP
jgi:hypothetical protein